MTDRLHTLNFTHQAALLGIGRNSICYEPRPASDADLRPMRRIDELHLDYPFAGSCMLWDLLREEGYQIGRQHVATLMEKRGIDALDRRPKTSKPVPGHKVYPYSLMKIEIARLNRVWAMDITYIPKARGFVYLNAVVDWVVRKVLACRLSITLKPSRALKPCARP